MVTVIADLNRAAGVNSDGMRLSLLDMLEITKNQGPRQYVMER